MIDPEKLFSREALDKMRSPEKLDTLLHVTNPVSWMGIAAIMLLLVGVVLWSFMGSFTVKVDGYGLITDAGGIRKIVSMSTGEVSAMYVTPGSKVQKYQEILRLDQASMSMDTASYRNNISLGSSYSDVAQRVNALDAKQASETLNERIYSSYNGIIGELYVDVGTVVKAGEEIGTIRLDEGRSDMMGVMYVPVSQGKRLEPGMTVQLAPNGTDTSQNGSLLGVVRSVSDYPVDSTSMVRNLGNTQLAQAILQQLGNAAVEVRFNLVKNESDESGYLWTSTVGEHKKITPGTYVSGSVVIERKAPIEKVFLKASQWLRSR